MADFTGKYQYSSAGSAVQEGACRVHFDAQTLTLTPQDGSPVVFDLGDLDAVIKGDWELRLPLYTGRTILLRQFGKAFEDLAHDLLEAYRNRTIQCLLLEDLAEIQRFTGVFELAGGIAAPPPGEGEFRLYKSNLAVLPAAGQAFQWRLADVDAVRFDAAAYEVMLDTGGQHLKITRLAKRTEEFVTRVRDAISALGTKSAQALHASFPFLNPDQLQAAAALMREGRAASVAKLEAIDPRIPVALTANAVDKDIKPYYERLMNRAATGALYAGFKLIRPEDKDVSATDAAPPSSSENVALSDAEDTDSAAVADSGAPETLYWFFLPITSKTSARQASNVVAWEASSRSGRATYFFRLTDPAQAAQLQGSAALEAGVQRLNRVLAMLNFRRRPIYLSDDELTLNPQFRRYAIAARRIPELRQARANFLGRAAHTSVEAWETQVASILAKAGV